MKLSLSIILLAFSTILFSQNGGAGWSHFEAAANTPPGWSPSNTLADNHSQWAFNLTTDEVWYWNGSAWVELKKFPTVAGSVISATETMPAGDSTATWQQVVNQMRDTITQIKTSTNVMDSIVYFGNSITFGFGVTGDNWTDIVAKAKGAFEHNLAISGTTMQNVNANSMINRLSQIPAKRATLKALCFMYGINDMINNIGTSATFAADYQTVINNAISKGWSASDIYVITPNAIVHGNASESEQDDFNTATLALTNCTIVDVYPIFKSLGAEATTVSDNIHLDSVGVGIISTELIGAMNLKVQNEGQDIAVEGVVEFDTIIARNLPVLSNLKSIVGLSTDGRLGIYPKHRQNGTFYHTKINVLNDAIIADNINVGHNGVPTNTLFTTGDISDLTGGNNTLFGNNVGNALTSGINNTLFGSQAGEDITTGGGNVAIGRSAGQNITTASNNTYLGYNAGRDNLAATGNIAIGLNSQLLSVSGSNNITVGNSSMSQSNGTTTNNVSLGNGTINALTTASYNVAVGNSALNIATTANRNIAIGGVAASGLYDKSNNITIGYLAGNKGSQSGDNNTIVGYSAGNNPVFTGGTINVADAATQVNPVNERITVTAHGFSWTGYKYLQPVLVSGSFPGGISTIASLFRVVDANTLESLNNITSTGSGSFNLLVAKDVSNATLIGANALLSESNRVTLGNSSVNSLSLGDNFLIHYGTGSPEGVVTSNIGSLYANRTSGDLYRKTTADNTNTGWVQTGLVSSLQDADNDTKIQVEESTDEDIIRFDVAGTQAMIVNNNARVGVGTSNPEATLSVVGAGNDAGTLSFSVRNSNNAIVTRYRNDGVQEFNNSFNTEPSAPATGAGISHIAQWGSGNNRNPSSLSVYTSADWRHIMTNPINVKILTTDHTIDIDDRTHVWLLSAFVGNVTITLPSPSGQGGKFYIIRPSFMTGTRTLTVSAGGSTINGDASYTFSGMDDGIMVVSDGNKWLAFGFFDPSYLSDDDADTKIEVEQTTDEDKIRMNVGGEANIMLVNSDRSVRINTNTAGTTGVEIEANSSSWASVSARNMKENFEVLDYQSLYEGFKKISIEKWNYRGSKNRNIGIMAEDFYEVFGKDLGVAHNHEKIETTDGIGAAMALIKAQSELIEDLQKKVASLKNQIKNEK